MADDLNESDNIVNDSLMDKPPEEIAKVFITSDEVRRTELYSQILFRIKRFLCDDDLAGLEKFDYVLDLITNDLDEVINLCCINPFINTNPIILCCKQKSIQSLTYLFDQGSKLLYNVTEKIHGQSALPTDEDNENHNAFYYALRSEQPELLQAVLQYWKRKRELTIRLLSDAYRKINLNNIPLTWRMEVLVKKLMIDFRFYNKSDDVQEVELSMVDKKHRIQLVLEEIEKLTDDSSCEFDDMWLVTAKFVVKNIFVLKRQLQSTYDRLPWEEMEFCLSIYIMSITTNEKNKRFEYIVLRRNSMVVHLKNFAKCLQTIQNDLKDNSRRDWNKIPKGKREDIKKQIIKAHDFFGNLYDDYNKVRDLISLKTMQSYTEAASVADCNGMEGRLVVTKCLQVVGEHLKNTLLSPKMSEMTIALLLKLLPKHTCEIVRGLRDSLSHYESLLRRQEIEESTPDCFREIQEDIKKMNDAIFYVISRNKIKIIKCHLQTIMDLEDEEVKVETSSFGINDIRETLSRIPMGGTLKRLRVLISDLESKISDKTPQEEKVFRQINFALELEQEKLTKVQMNLLDNLNIYNSYCTRISTGTQWKQILKDAHEINNYIECDIGTATLNTIAHRTNDVINSFKYRNSGDAPNQIINIAMDIFHIVAFEINRIKWIEEYKWSLEPNINPRCRNSGDEQIKKKMLLQKLKILNEFLKDYSFRSYVDHKLLSDSLDQHKQIAIEMVIMDIMSIMGSSGKDLTDNPLFLDIDPPTFIGKNLRNHLAHENILSRLFSYDFSADLFLNALKLKEEIKVNERLVEGKIDKIIPNDLSALKKRYDEDLKQVRNKLMFFESLAKGKLDDVKKCLEHGVDISSRCIKLRTALHFASMAPTVEVLKFVLSCKKNTQSKDIEGFTALHTAVLSERKENVKILINEDKMLLDVMDRNGKTPLLLAAEKGNIEIVNILIESGSIVNIQNASILSPLYSLLINHDYVSNRFINFQTPAYWNDSEFETTLLHAAVRLGNLELLQYFLERKANVNAESDAHQTLLQTAVISGNEQICKLLVDCGAIVNARSLYGYTALHYAVRFSNKSVVTLLLENEADVNDNCNMFKITPLAIAARNGIAIIVKLLLRFKANRDIKDIGNATPLQLASISGHQAVVELLTEDTSISFRDEDRCTSLHYAAQKGHGSIVEHLIKKGANVNSTITPFKYTPLMISSMEGHKNVVKVLIQRNADINQIDVYKSSALYYCCQSQSPENAQLFLYKDADYSLQTSWFGLTPFQLALGTVPKVALDHFFESGANTESVGRSDFTALHLAALNDDVEVVKCIIDRRCEINAKSKSGLNALHLAAQENHIETLKLLIKNGAHIDAKDYHGKSPLHYAANKNHKKVLNCLINKGAEVKDEGFGEPLASAVCSGRNEIVKLLLKKGDFDVNVKMSNNNTLLSSAVLGHYTSIVKILLEEEHIDVNVLANNVTPLFIATLKGRSDLVKLLLSMSADPNIRCHGSRMPIAEAIGRGYVNIIKLLFDKGAETKNVDLEGRSALQLAVQCNQLEAVALLLKLENVDINERLQASQTLLHIATIYNNIEIVKFLIDKGANIDATVNEMNAIHFAASLEDTTILDYLLSFESRNVRLNEIKTLLLFSIKNGYIESTQYLFEKIKETNMVHSVESLLFRLALEKNDEEFLVYLLKNGVPYNVYKLDNERIRGSAWIPDLIKTLQKIKLLFKAIKVNNSSEVEKLIKDSVIVDAKRVDGATPLHYAAWKGHSKIILLLLKDDANPNITGKSMSTPLHYASKFGHYDIVKELLINGAVYNSISNIRKTPRDYATANEIVGLFEIIEKSFNGVKNNDTEILNFLKGLNGSDALKVLPKIHDAEKRNLLTHAIRHEFQKSEELRNFLQDDMCDVYRRAIGLMKMERFSESLILFRCILSKRIDVFGNNNIAVLDIKHKIGEVLLGQHCYEKSLKIFNEVLKERKVLLGMQDLESLNIRKSIARATYKVGKRQEALNIFEAVIKQESNILGYENTDFIQTQLYKLEILIEGGCAEDALQFGYSIQKSLSQENCKNQRIHMDLKESMVIARLKQEENSTCFGDIMQSMQSLYEKKRKILGPIHPSTLRTLRKLGSILFSKGCLSEALKIYQRVLSLQEHILGRCHPESLETRNIIGKVMFSQKKYFCAFKVFIEDFDLRKSFMGSHHPEILSTEEMVNEIKLVFRIKDGLEGYCLLEQMQKNAKKSVVAKEDGDSNFVECSVTSCKRLSKEDFPELFFIENFKRLHKSMIKVLINLSTNFNCYKNSNQPVQVHQNHDEFTRARLIKESSKLLSKLLKQNHKDKLGPFFPEELQRSLLSNSSVEDSIRELSRLRAVDMEVSEPWVTYSDKDVFHYIAMCNGIENSKMPSKM